MRRIVAITGTIVFLDAMLFGAIIPLLPHFADRYDLSKLEAGLPLGAHGRGGASSRGLRRRRARRGYPRRLTRQPGGAEARRSRWPGRALAREPRLRPR